MKIPQRLPEEIAPIDTRTNEQDIASEAVFRRGDPDFVARMGGAFAKRILEVAKSLDMVRDNTRIMVQKTPMVRGAYPDVPQWHVDCMPGIQTKLAEAVRQRIDGLICVLLDRNLHTNGGGTLFLNGELDMKMDAEDDSDYVPGGYLSLDAGDVNWIHPQVEAQLYRTVHPSAILPNVIYRYRSDQLHRAPVMTGNSGHRIVVRLNTPPDDFEYEIPVQNTIITPEPNYIFRVNEERTRWTRESHQQA